MKTLRRLSPLNYIFSKQSGMLCTESLRAKSIIQRFYFHVLWAIEFQKLFFIFLRLIWAHIKFLRKNVKLQLIFCLNQPVLRKKTYPFAMVQMWFHCADICFQSKHFRFHACIFTLQFRYFSIQIFIIRSVQKHFSNAW